VIAADGNYGATENCSSSGANNYTVSASMNGAYDTLTLTGFPIASYTVRAVAQTGGYRIFPQTVSAVMDVEGTVACDGSILTATYTRTSLQGTGASETCTSVLRK